MTSPCIASARLVCHAALLVLLTGCGVVTNTKGPQPVGVGSSAVPVAPTGLQLGSVFQSQSGNLFPILGISGAAHYGSPSLPADAKVMLAGAMASPSASWALVLGKDGALQEWEFPASTASTLASRVALDSSLMFSPSGTYAALLSASTQTLVIIGGLPSKPLLTSISVPAGALARSFAISDSGTVLLGVKRPSDGRIDLGVLSETRGYAAIGTLQGWGGAAFAPGTAGDAAVIADNSTAQLTYVTNLGGATPAFAALPNAGVLQKPAAVGISSDGKWAYAADAGKPQVVQVSLASSATAPVALPCACSPERMIPLTSDGIFSLTSNIPGKPDWILDTRPARQRVFFVPALAAASPAQTSASAITQSDRASR